MATSPAKPARLSTKSCVKRIFRAIGWDGVLPVLVASGPVFVKAMFPKGHIAEVIAAVLVPILAALIRASVGWRQIARVCHDRAPWLRQMALAAAIVLLLLFEVAVSVLTFAGDAPASAWWLPAVLYAAYIFMITRALRPEPASPGIVTTA